RAVQAALDVVQRCRDPAQANGDFGADRARTSLPPGHPHDNQAEQAAILDVDISSTCRVTIRACKCARAALPFAKLSPSVSMLGCEASSSMSSACGSDSIVPSQTARLS